MRSQTTEIQVGRGQAELRNLILSRLDSDDYALLAPDLVSMAFVRGQVLCEHDNPVETVFFAEAGVISIVGRTAEGQISEVGIIGREGLAHPAPLLGALSIPHRLEIQIEGHGFRLPRHALMEATHRSPKLLNRLLLFVQALLVQVSCTAVSNALHSVDIRLARWLLMCHDRMDTDDLRLTHHFMAAMLAVRRPSVTSSLHTLEGQGLISTDRGYVTLTNRVALEGFAGGAYGGPEKEYAELLGGLR